MLDELFFINQPVLFQNGIYIYPPKVKEIIVNKKFDAFKQILTYSQEEIEDEYVAQNKDLKNLLTPLEFLIYQAFGNQNNDMLTFIKEAFEFFIKEPVTILPQQKMVIVGDIKKELKKVKDISALRIIKEDNFFEFQNLIRQACGDKAIEPYNSEENIRIKKMKAKVRYREKLKAKNKDGLSLKALIAAICCMGIGITPLNVGELSYASVLTLLKYYQNKEEYDIGIKQLLAGAKSKDVKLKYWIRNIED